MSIMIVIAMCLDFSRQEEDILRRSNGKCHLCTF